MIKCDVTISGAISRSGDVRTNKDGKTFLSFFVCVNFVGRNGETVKQDIAVYYDKADMDASQFYVGRRVDLTGALTFRKRGETLYINLSAETVNLNSTVQEDAVKGSMQFRGSLGKHIEVKTDKNGKPMLIFSAFSAEKVANKREQRPSSLGSMPSDSNLGVANVNDNFEYVWVRFIGFGIPKEDWLEPKSKIEASGELELSVYNGKLNIGCRLSEYKQHFSTPF